LSKEWEDQLQDAADKQPQYQLTVVCGYHVQARGAAVHRVGLFGEREGHDCFILL
jgi:hypothetical protein